VKIQTAPIRNLPQYKKPWEGNCIKKPWEYQITAVIPVMDTFEQLEICVRLLKSQTIKPYIVVIDTGSVSEEFEKIEQLRSEELEVHSLRLNGVLHPSDFPAIAMDLAFSLCRTEYLYATHADCFLRRRDFLESLLESCSASAPVIGYEISPRSHADWQGMVSHTASLYHMPTMDKIGFGWSMRRLANHYNIKDYRPDPSRPQWPDTEILGNYILRKNKIKPILIGKEPNFERKKDENIDHFRSFTSGKLYSSSYYKQVMVWYTEAKKEALERLEMWERQMKDRMKSETILEPFKEPNDERISQ
jgi:hypothetical protein